MKLPDDRSAFSDRGANAFGRSRMNVADCEDTRNARLERQTFAVEFA
jgi:hypothetical protein